MGYTNYWYQSTDIPDDKWKLIKKEYNDYVKPVAGKLVFFPATWQHPHRGNPIYDGYKYIITGWFTYDE